MSCKTQVPVAEIAQAVADMLGTPAPPANLDSTILNTPIIRGDVALDAAAKESLCAALTNCILDAVNPRLQAVEVEVEEALRRADEALRVAQVAKGGSIVEVANEGDLRHIRTQNGSRFTFSVADSPTTSVSNDIRAMTFQPEGDNIVITLTDGQKLDLTRQEFADWLTEKDSSLATDSEIQAIVDGGNNQVIQELEDRINNLDYDQAVLTRIGDNLVLTNDDGSTSTVSLNGLVKLSDTNGNLLRLYEDGLYYGIEAEANVSNIYVDGEYGDDSLGIKQGGGTEENPFKTYDQALRISPRDKSNTIHLRSRKDNGALQTYVQTINHKIQGGAARDIKTYDNEIAPEAQIACWRENQDYVIPYKIREESRPLIKREWSKYLSGGVEKQLISRTYFEGGSTINYYGVRVELTPPQFDEVNTPVGSMKARAMHIGDGSAIMYGSDFVDTVDNKTLWGLTELGDTMYLAFAGVEVPIVRDFSVGSPLISIGAGSIVLNTQQPNDLGVPSDEVLQTCGASVSTVSVMQDEMTAILQQDGAVSGIVRDVSGTTLNVSSNFEL